MFRRAIILATLAGIALTVLTSSMGFASPVGSYKVAVGARQSDSNLRWARYRLGENIDQLRRDQRDYGGYRVKAIAFFQDAQRQITLGLRYDAGRDIAVSRPDLDAGLRPFLRGPNVSDANLRAVRRNVEHIIDVLQRDNHDYGGHRVAAIGLIQRGRQMISLALRYDRGH